jgi:hypothetical protein
MERSIVTSLASEGESPKSLLVRSSMSGHQYKPPSRTSHSMKGESNGGLTGCMEMHTPMSYQSQGHGTLDLALPPGTVSLQDQHDRASLHLGISLC